MEKLTGVERGRSQVMCPSPSSQATNRRAMTSLKAGAFEKLMIILVWASDGSSLGGPATSQNISPSRKVLGPLSEL